MRQAVAGRILTRFDDLPAHDPGDRPQEMDSEETAYMIFTSGSTGVPKGVLVPVRAVANLLSSLQSIYGFKPEDRFSKAYNLNFDGSVHDMFGDVARRSLAPSRARLPTDGAGRVHP